MFEESKRNEPKGSKEDSTWPSAGSDRPLNKSEVRDIVDTKEIRKLQRTDDTLKHVRAEASGRTEPSNTGFFVRDGLVYRRWVPAKPVAEEYRD